MKCSMLKADLFKNGLIESPGCACGAANEDTFHYLFECQNFRVERDRLQNLVIPLAPFTVQTLLFGSDNCTLQENEKIFLAVHSYINSTGRPGAVTWIFTIFPNDLNCEWYEIIMAHPTIFPYLWCLVMSSTLYRVALPFCLSVCSGVHPDCGVSLLYSVFQFSFLFVRKGFI